MRRKIKLIFLANIVLCLLAFEASFSVQAQTVTSFTRSSQFSILQNNGSIHFAYSGNYSSATLQDGVWTFINLQLNNSVSRTGAGTIPKFTVSSTNSNITVYTAYVNRTSLAYVRFGVVGSGKQIFNFGINATRTNAIWTVTINKPTGTSYPPQNNGWHVDSDGTITVNAPSGSNVTVQYSITNRPNVSSLPFYLQHSVVITIGAVIAVVVALTLVMVLWNHTHATQDLKQQPNLKQTNSLKPLPQKSQTKNRID